MTQAVAVRNNGQTAPELIEQVVIKGDLSKLSPQERANYYGAVCRSVGLNPLTKPFDYIALNGKLTLYALRNCTDQLRAIHKISVVEMTETERDGVHVVTCKVSNADGRTDMAKGAVHLGPLKGEALANAIMKAETKAKRRATLSICGLSLLDETEIADIPAEAKRPNPHVNRPEDIVDVPTEGDADRIPDGDPTIKAMPKKNARADFDIFQKTLHAMKTTAELDDWGAHQADRIATYPEDWREIARGLFVQHKAALRAKEAQSTGDPGPIPDFLDRSKATPNGEQWLRDLDGAYGGCEDNASFFEIDKTMFLPNIAGAFPPDRERAQEIRDGHLRRLEGNQE